MTNEQQRLSQASGALADITILVTGCVSKEASKKTQELAESVLLRILCSADCVKRKPSWYIHSWEERAWERYLNGELKACASDRACVDVSEELIKDGRIDPDSTGIRLSTRIRS